MLQFETSMMRLDTPSANLSNPSSPSSLSNSSSLNPPSLNTSSFNPSTLYLPTSNLSASELSSLINLKSSNPSWSAPPSFTKSSSAPSPSLDTLPRSSPSNGNPAIHETGMSRTTSVQSTVSSQLWSTYAQTGRTSPTNTANKINHPNALYAAEIISFSHCPLATKPSAGSSQLATIAEVKKTNCSKTLPVVETRHSANPSDMTQTVNHQQLFSDSTKILSREELFEAEVAKVLNPFSFNLGYPSFSPQNKSKDNDAQERGVNLERSHNENILTNRQLLDDDSSSLHDSNEQSSDVIELTQLPKRNPNTKIADIYSSLRSAPPAYPTFDRAEHAMAAAMGRPAPQSQREYYRRNSFSSDNQSYYTEGEEDAGTSHIKSPPLTSDLLAAVNAAHTQLIQEECIPLQGLDYVVRAAQMMAAAVVEENMAASDYAPLGRYAMESSIEEQAQHRNNLSRPNTEAGHQHEMVGAYNATKGSKSKASKQQGRKRSRDDTDSESGGGGDPREKEDKDFNPTTSRQKKSGTNGTGTAKRARTASTATANRGGGKGGKGKSKANPPQTKNEMPANNSRKKQPNQGISQVRTSTQTVIKNVVDQKDAPDAGETQTVQMKPPSLIVKFKGKYQWSPTKAKSKEENQHSTPSISQVHAQQYSIQSTKFGRTDLTFHGKESVVRPKDEKRRPTPRRFLKETM